MAVILNSKRETFEVVLSVDSALDMSEEEFSAYRETLDDGLLKFKDGQEPTRWVMRKVLPFGLAKKVQNEQMTSVNGEMRVQMSFMSEEVKASLVDVKNPPGVPDDQQIKYERDKDGSTSEKLMELLISAGIVPELYSARQVKLGSVNESLKKK
jgi:hypothetical protein